jgi:hypothetical protein
MARIAPAFSTQRFARDKRGANKGVITGSEATKQPGAALPFLDRLVPLAITTANKKPRGNRGAFRRRM